MHAPVVLCLVPEDLEAVCCSLAVYCIVLQCAATCCSVMQWNGVAPEDGDVETKDDVCVCLCVCMCPSFSLDIQKPRVVSMKANGGGGEWGDTQREQELRQGQDKRAGGGHACECVCV